MRINWDKVYQLLNNKVLPDNIEVINTNVCISWYSFMLRRNI